MPVVDHSKFGEIETVALSRIKKISGAHLHRSWVTVPHVTHFDEADITETYRHEIQPVAQSAVFPIQQCGNGYTKERKEEQIPGVLINPPLNHAWVQGLTSYN